MDVYIGFDISLQTTHACVVGNDGEIVREGVERTEVGALDAWLRTHGTEWTIKRIVFETGQLSAHLYHGLRSSWPVICIDARHAHGTLKAQRIKNDRNDARGLAQIARTGWYKPVHVKSQECQALRALVGGRKQLVMLRLGLENHIRGTLKALGIKLGPVTTAAFSIKVSEAIDDRDDVFKQTILTVLQARDDLLARQRVLDRACIGIAKSSTICRRLMTIPGVGPITALTFRAEIDDPLRFKKSRDVGVHVGLTPRRYASGETDISGGISKCGNRALRTLLFEASVTMLTRSGRWNRLKAWGVRLAQRKGFKAASVALARKIAIVMHRMWIDGTDFAYGEPPSAQAA